MDSEDIKKNKESKYPEIPAIKEDIIKASEQGKLVVFVGAGASKIIGCPSWRELAVNVLQYLYESKCINYHEFENLQKLDSRKILSICRQIIFEKKPNPAPDYKKLLTPSVDLANRYKVYENLYSWKAIYITTNFDECFDKVAQEKRPPNITTESPQSVPQSKIESELPSKIVNQKRELLISNLNQGSILHLHGSISDEEHLIVTTFDYLKHYEFTQDNPIPVLLDKVFNEYTVLFVGYGLEEYEILEYLISKARPTKEVLQHYMLYPMFIEEENLFEFQYKYYAKLRICLIPYPIGENGYEQLSKVIEDWAKVIGLVAKPQGFYDKVKIIDEVI